VTFVDIIDPAADSSGIGLVECVFFTLAVARSTLDIECSATTAASRCKVIVWAGNYSSG